MSMRKQKIISRWFRQRSRDSIHLEQIERKDSEIVLRAVQDNRTFFVYLDISGNGRHHCTCQDWSWRELIWRVDKGALICRHIVAAALQEGQAALILPLLAC